MTYYKTGSEFIVNANTDGTQSEPEIIALANGNVAVEWYQPSYVGPLSFPQGDQA